jgi:hypothetical protein
VQAGDGKNMFLKIGQRLAFEELAFLAPHSKPGPQGLAFSCPIDISRNNKYAPHIRTEVEGRRMTESGTISQLNSLGKGNSRGKRSGFFRLQESRGNLVPFLSGERLKEFLEIEIHLNGG